MFTLKIATDNAAFGDNELDARATLRYLLVTQVSDGLETSANGGTIRDENGNTVGEWQITTAEILAPLPGTCYICGNGDEDLKPTRYGLTVGRLPAEWQNVNVPMCPECRTDDGLGTGNYYLGVK